jgi:acetolactate synthase-1/2/3 large subunit
VTTKLHVYQSIARAIKDHGVETMFGLMGDANLFMVDSFVRDCGGRFVPAAHEGSSVLMALAYTHVSGAVAVATVTHGPALTNCLTAITEGVRGHLPIVLFAGDTPAENPRHLQGIDQRELIKATGAGFEQLRTPETVAMDVARAFYRAQVERRPIILNMPADFMWQEATYEKHVLNVFTAPGGVAEGGILDEAIGMIASARRPMILAGGGAIDARDQLIRLADRLEAPLATTLKAKGLFQDHPYNIDIFGTLSTPAAYDLIAQTDCIVCFGTGLHDFTTDRGKLMRDKRIVQVDVEPTAIGGALHPDAALLADAGLTAETILYWLNEAEIPASGFTRELDTASLTAHPVDKKTTADGFRQLCRRFGAAGRCAAKRPHSCDRWRAFHDGSLVPHLRPGSEEFREHGQFRFHWPWPSGSHWRRDRSPRPAGCSVYRRWRLYDGRHQRVQHGRSPRAGSYHHRGERLCLRRGTHPVPRSSNGPEPHDIPVAVLRRGRDIAGRNGR